MKRTYNVLAAAAAAAMLGGLAGCSGSTADAAESKPAAEQAAAPEAPTVPANDDERVCRAVTADLEVGDKRLDNVDAGEAARVLSVAEDIEGRLERYPAARADLKDQVQKVADAYSAAASKLADADAYAAQVVKVRTAQTKLLGMCS